MQLNLILLKSSRHLSLLLLW